MNATFCELRDKEVISVKDGRRLGFISDLEIDLCTGNKREKALTFSTLSGTMSVRTFPQGS